MSNSVVYIRMRLTPAELEVLKLRADDPSESDWEDKITFEPCP